MKLDTTDSRRSVGPASASGHPQPSGQSLGADLKAARISKQITLQQVAEDTHISLRHFQNIEDGQYGELPGGMYNRAFLRRYVEYLGLEPNSYLERYERESAPQGEKIVKPKVRNVDLPSRPVRVPPVLIWGVMLVVSVVGLYFSRHWIAAVFSPYFSRPPAARLTEAKPTPAAPVPAAPQPNANVTLTTGSQPTAPQPSSVPATRAVQPTPVPAVTSNVAAQPPLEHSSASIHLEIHAVDRCWISVNGDGKRQLEKTLEPGEDQIFDASERFEIVFGNAGGVNLKINGKPAKPLGKSGEVLKLLINAQNIDNLLQKVTD